MTKSRKQISVDVHGILIFLLFVQQKFKSSLQGKPYMEDGQLCQNLNGAHKGVTARTSLSPFRLFSLNHKEKVRSGFKQVELVRVYLVKGFTHKNKIDRFAQTVFDSTLFSALDFNKFTELIDGFKKADAAATLLIESPEYHSVDWKKLFKELRRVIDDLEESKAFSDMEIASFRDYVHELEACVQQA